MNKTLVLLASILIATTPLAGCIDGDTLEEIIDDVVGCMDTEAKNYDENATTELVGNCIYAASKEAFMDAMNQEINLQSMLNQSTTAGYSMSMTAPMGDELGDMGDDMMILIEETVMGQYVCKCSACLYSNEYPNVTFFYNNNDTSWRSC